MNQPRAMITTEELAVKKKLFNGLRVMSRSMICAPDWDIPCSMGSIADGIKLAEKPPETPANAAAIPASG